MLTIPLLRFASFVQLIGITLPVDGQAVNACWCRAARVFHKRAAGWPLASLIRFSSNFIWMPSGKLPWYALFNAASGSSSLTAAAIAARRPFFMLSINYQHNMRPTIRSIITASHINAHHQLVGSLWAGACCSFVCQWRVATPTALSFKGDTRFLLIDPATQISNKPK